MPPCPLRRMAVVGESMAPLLRPGDFLLVWTWSRPRAPVGSLVVVSLPARPLAVKRLHRRLPDGSLWVLGDNAGASTDSRTLGPLPATALRGRVLARYWPLRRAA